MTTGTERKQEAQFFVKAGGSLMHGLRCIRKHASISCFDKPDMVPETKGGGRRENQRQNNWERWATPSVRATFW